MKDLKVTRGTQVKWGQKECLISGKAVAKITYACETSPVNVKLIEHSRVLAKQALMGES